MTKLKLGLQMHAVREDFAENPSETLKEIKKMGYHGVELNYSALNMAASEYRKMMDDSGLECFGVLVGWDELDKDILPDVMDYCRGISADKLIIGQVPPDVLNAEPDAPKKAMEYIKELHNVLSQNGFVTGYHSHDSDFTVCISGTSFYEYVMDNTTSDFLMVLDTGNTVAGGGNPLELIKKYPNRAKIVHIKGYSDKNKYLTPVWEADYGLESVLEAAAIDGGTEFLDIEFGARGDYIPMERAKKSAKWLIEKTEKWR